MEENLYHRLCDMLCLEPVNEKIAINDFSNLTLLAQAQSNTRFTASLGVLINRLGTLGFEFSNFDKYVIDKLITEIDLTLSAQIDEILKNDEFKSLESLWRSLDYLCDFANSGKNIKIQLLDVSKDALLEDFLESSDITQSGLYTHVYTDEYDTPGGYPITAMISAEKYTSGSQDISLLASIAKVAALAHCPYIASISPKFFHCQHMHEVSDISDLTEYMSQVEFSHWQSFRNTEESRYVGLTLPEFLLRLPYGQENRVQNFSYHESCETHKESYLWGAASFAFASNMMRSFNAYGWTVSIRGPESGGKISNLPIHVYDVGRGRECKMPTTMLIPESKELTLANLGFIPLSYYKGTDFACFFSANSVHQPKKFDDDYANANSQVNARLPYILLASRLAHYLKVIQRENIGAAKDKTILQKELNSWLANLVTEMPNPSSELIAKRPLREGYVEVRALPDNPGFYQVQLFAVPHFQVEGIDVRLSLVGQMPSST